MNAATAPTPQSSLGELAARCAGAARVFHRHGLDFCCRGHHTLADACRSAGLEPRALLAEIEREAPADERFESWTERPLGELIAHVLERYHAAHRAELPRLIAMAQRVEQAHAGRDDCPRRLAAHLEQMAESLEEHMQKEEQILFPLLASGRGQFAVAPIQVMESEHRDHGASLERLRGLAQGFVAPPDACATWRALYLGLVELERELMQHIHLENHVLFPRALRA